MDSRLRASLARLDGRDPYTVLGLTNTATQQEINRAYRRLAAKWHPDRWPPGQYSAAEISAAKQTFAHVQASAAVLRDPASRASYSEWSAASAQAAEPAPSTAAAPYADPWDSPATGAPPTAGAEPSDIWDGPEGQVDGADLGGLVPFRPLTLREMLTAAVRLLASYPLLVFGVAGGAATLGGLAQLWAQTSLDLGGSAYAPYLRFALAAAFSLPVAAAGLGIIVAFTGDVIVWGSRLTQLLRRTGGRLPYVLGLTALFTIVIMVCLGFAQLVSFWFALPAIAMCILYSLAVPVAVLEIVTIDEAFARAGMLVRYSPLRMACIALTNLGIAAAAAALTAIPFAMAGGWAVFDLSADLTTTQALLRAGWMSLAGTFVLAWFPVTGTLLYVDQVIRQEEMAEQLAEAAQRLN